MRKTACSSILKTNVYLNFKSDSFFFAIIMQLEGIIFHFWVSFLQYKWFQIVILFSLRSWRWGLVYYILIKLGIFFHFQLWKNSVYAVNPLCFRPFVFTGITYNRKEVMLSKNNFDLCPAIQNFRLILALSCQIICLLILLILIKQCFL